VRAFQAAGASDAPTTLDDSEEDDEDDDCEGEEPCGKRPRHRGGRTRVREHTQCTSSRRGRLMALPGRAPRAVAAPRVLTRAAVTTQGVQLTLEAVRGVQHLALRAAAARCNMGTTQVCVCACEPWCHARLRAARTRARADVPRRAASQFKLQCRKLGIARWPHRKLKSLNGLITSCKAASNRMRSEKLKDALTEWTAQLEAVKVRGARARASVHACAPTRARAARRAAPGHSRRAAR
jgi:hypothetical protein